MQKLGEGRIFIHYTLFIYRAFLDQYLISLRIPEKRPWPIAHQLTLDHSFVYLCLKSIDIVDKLESKVYTYHKIQSFLIFSHTRKRDEHNLGSAVGSEGWVNQTVQDMSLEINNSNSFSLGEHSLAVLSLGSEMHQVLISRCANGSLHYQGKFYPEQLMIKNLQVHPETGGEKTLPAISMQQLSLPNRIKNLEYIILQLFL